jgi:hypothetical protein
MSLVVKDFWTHKNLCLINTSYVILEWIDDFYLTTEVLFVLG